MNFKGDIDPEYNYVEVTDEARAELARIENKIGDFTCKLCEENFVDAFGLAQHRLMILREKKRIFFFIIIIDVSRCSKIVLIEYRCSECDKSFPCHANMASHRRWHEHQHRRRLKPPPIRVEDTPRSTTFILSCQVCHTLFETLEGLGQHQAENHSDTFPCQLCPEIFYCSAGLTRHLNRFHKT